MDWFEEFEEIEAVAAPAVRERELVPEGRHTFTIKKVVDTADKFRVDLAHANPSYGWVFVNCPKDRGWGQRIIVSLAKALGYGAVPWKSATPEQLAARVVDAEVYHRLGNDGRTFVNVRKFLTPDPEAPVVEAKPAHTRARTADQKLKAEQRGGGDDIPF